MIMLGTTIIAALRLPSGVLHSLESGDISVIHARNKPNQDFCLCSNDSDASQVKVSAWARCEGSQQFSEKNKCDILAAHLQISTESLQSALERNGFIWLTYLRVYHLPSPIMIKNSTKGVFIALENRIYIDKLQPVLDDRNFEIQKERLLKLEPPESLIEKIERTLNEATAQQKLESQQNLAWINRITEVGNSSGGNEFEKLVRKSFMELGFSNSNKNPKASLDPESTGGAGGIDLCCENPYSIVGECKASAYQKIPTEVCSQLTYLGQAHYPDYHNAIKIIIAAGSLNYHSEPIAIGNKMNVIRPETLEQLVKLKTAFAGSINLWELKLCLENAPFGEDSNSKLLDFIKKAEVEIKLRSSLIQAVYRLSIMGTTHPNVERVCTQYNQMFFTDKESVLDDNTVKDILIELSSPLAGYLGREKDDRGSDRFYYLRDLPIENEKHN
jgi:Domain of unknown function (DUF1802)